MAKKIHQIAKELGLKSKELVARCEAEGIPNIVNHMSTVSAGLEQTIQSWYAGGAVETETESSDEAGALTAVVARKTAKKVRATAKKKSATQQTETVDETASMQKALEETRKIAKKGAAESSEEVIRRVEAQTAANEAAAAPPTVEPEQAQPRIPVESAALAPAASAAPPPAMAPEEEQVAAQAPARPAPARRRAVAVPNVPKRPEEVAPAGPKLENVQSPARLSGPKVVRIEEAEVVDRPRRRTLGEGGPGGRGGPGVSSPAEAPAGGDVSRRNTRRKNRSGREGRSASAEGPGERPGRLRNWGQQDLLEREERLRGAHGYIKTVRRDATRPDHGGERAKSAVETGGVVRIQEPFSIRDLSAATGVQVNQIVRAMMKKGIMQANPNAGMPVDLAVDLMLEHNIELEVEEKKSAVDVVTEEFEKREAVDVQPRAPVVAILGHVDHGKTSLLDAIRQTNVAAGEAGGITQHTSAFRINVRAGDDEKTIVFLDTPGHEAFTAMRARGAQITDIVVLVVAADDGLMPQTIESINHARAAGVPIVVALNKIDKPEATDSNIQRIYGQLAEYELSPIEWGGKTEVVKTSATKRIGIQDLLDTLDFQAQTMELQADARGPARGTVIEARMVEGRGPVANVLIQDGRIKVGDCLVIGRAYGRVRDMVDDRGNRLKEAGPSTPLEISGISLVPDAGDRCYVVSSLRKAEEAAEQRVAQERERALAAPKVTLDNIFTQLKGADRKELNLVVKADVQGSVETLKRSLEDISTEELQIRVLHAAVGGINESDVLLAETSGAIVLGFHVIASARARELAEARDVEMRTYQVIYELLDEVRQAASGLLAPEIREEVLGHATVREVFKISKVGMVAGCYVTDGTIERNARIRVTRNDIVVENNRVLEQLKRFKDDAREVRSGQECGMKIEGYDDIKPGDILECYRMVEISRKI
ncbi:MAG: translation initiation factor IF-2 [Phycisphaerales bacterium]|nr:translation initiation factor IF-2 [Phycisphaerales bacterium]